MGIWRIMTEWDVCTSERANGKSLLERTYQVNPGLQYRICAKKTINYSYAYCKIASLSKTLKTRTDYAICL